MDFQERSLGKIVRHRRVRKSTQEERADSRCHQLEQPPEGSTIALSVKSHQLLFRGFSAQPSLSTSILIEMLQTKPNANRNGYFREGQP
jgi:hypothetical protein